MPDPLLREASARLRRPLPAFPGTPRLIRGDGDTLSALAWCQDHTRWDAGDAPSVLDAPTLPCWNCDIVELGCPELAELVHALLAAREQTAGVLDAIAALPAFSLIAAPGTWQARGQALATALLGKEPAHAR